MRTRRAFTSEWGLKLFSLALGLAIFFAVRTDQEVTTTVGLRLLLREPAGLINTHEVPAEITVRLSGSAGAIRALAPERFAPVVLDLQSLEKGTTTLRIRDEHLGLPPELGIVSISPSTVTVRLETRTKKRVPVKPELRGAPADGFVVERATVDPGEVQVEGPQREVDEIRLVRTAPVDVAGATEDFTASVAYAVPGSHTRIAGGAGRAEVAVAIGPVRAERVVDLRVKGVPGAAQAVPVRARLAGPRRVVDALDEAELSAVAVEREGGGWGVEIENLPAGVELLDPRPVVPSGR